MVVLTLIINMYFLSIRHHAASAANHAVPVLRDAERLLELTFEIDRLVWAHLWETDLAAKLALAKQIEAQTTTAAELANRLEAAMKTEEDRRMFETMHARRTEYVHLRSQLLETSQRSTRDEAFAFKAQRVRPALVAYLDSLKALADMAAQDAQNSVDSTLAAATQGVSAALVGTLLAILSAAVLGWTTHKSMMRLLRPVLATLQQGAVQLASAAAQVTSTSQSLAQGASEQAASLEETSASLEELTAMTQRNAANAQQARQLATQTRAAVEAGQSEMIQLTRAMDDIQTASAEISKIIKTIDEIAFQTNLLALNAAVEAARAGEAGMGFAVVADEVRALAQRAAAAARETAEKIENSVAKSQAGAGISQRVAQHLEQILTKARQVDELVAEIAAASQEQSQGIGQINSAVSQMDKVTQANAAAAEQSAAAAQELTAQAASLRQAVQALVQLVGDTGGTSAETASGHDPFRHSSRSRRAEKAPAQSAGFTAPARANRPEPVTVGHEV
mgnify:CR=1 FL=1